MKANRLTWMVLVLWVGALPLLVAQESAADHKQTAETKGKADKGSAEAFLELAARYSSGDGVTRDPAKAAKLHRRAAELGSARGQCLLALDYADGIGVKKNMTEAVRWMARASDQGLAIAQFDLGVYYASGEVVGRSIVDAAELYRKAADQGLTSAEAVLGNCYFEGTGVPKSIPEGVKWTRKAAEKGHPGAQQALGICYAKGKGVTTNYVQAYKWLALAASKDNQNSDDIKVNLSMAERFMTPEQVTEAQRLANEFVPSNVSTAHDSASKDGSTNSQPAGAGPASATSARIGVVSVKADDDTHEIFVDGAFVGNAPAKLKLTEGPHLVEVKKAGFKDYRKQIQVGEGAELTLRAVLEKQ